MCDGVRVSLKPMSGDTVRVGFVSTWRVRGLGHSFGAGGSLVAAALCCLVTAGALLAFRDWPAASAAAPEGRLSLRVPPVKVAGRAAAGPVAAPAPGAAPTPDAR